VKRYIASILTLIAMIATPSSMLHASETDFPFDPGERLTFKVYWTFIPAGEVTFEILPPETINGILCLRFVMTARTYEAVDLIYKVRDRIDSYTDQRVTRSILFKKQQEGKSKRRIIVDFDWEKQQVQYSNFGEKRDPIPLLPGAFDPVSVFYAFRLHALAEGRELEVPVTDGKKCVVGKARVIKREKIMVSSVPYDTFLVEPEMKQIGGIFEKSEKANLQVWVTSDKDHIPVKIKSRVIVGSFVAELTSVEKGRPDDTLSK
jgi:hypothetical protein